MSTTRESPLSWPDFTLGAGPIDASPRTLRAMAQPILYFDDPAFMQIFTDVTEKMKQVLFTKNDLIIMQGEAVLGLESIAYSCIEPGDKCLNLVSGVFGKGYEWYIKLYGGEPIELRVDYNDAIDPEDVRKVIKQNPGLKTLSVVHSETPSGTLNPIREICSIAKEYGLLTIVDAVSSAGGIELMVDDWGIDLCVVGPQKCLASSPGLSAIAVSDYAWEVMHKKNPPRYSFLSILDWKELWLEKQVFPYTPSTTFIYGFNEALDQLLEEGIESAWQRHDRVARACRAGVKAMGLTLWPKREEISSSCTTAIKMPEGLSQRQLRLHMRNQYGVMISCGYGEMVDWLVRIGHMGYAAKPAYIVIALAALGKSMRDLGVPVDIGAGIEAALSEF